MGSPRWMPFAAIAVVLIIAASSFAVIGFPTSGMAAPANAAPIAVSTTSVPAAVAPTPAVSVSPSLPASSSLIAKLADEPPAAHTSLIGISSQRVTAVDVAREAAQSAGTLSDFLPPTVNAPLYSAAATAGHIIPTYAEAPAPLGIADFGLRNTTGTITPYIQNTTSVEATFSTSDPWGVQTQYLDFGTQSAYGAQLNLVLVNVTVLGSNGVQNAIQDGQPYSYWLQNVLNYNPEATSAQLSFENNIWNFSNPTFDFPSGTSAAILHGGGSINSNEYYAVSGPSVTVTYPFTLEMYVNTSVSYSYVNSGTNPGTCVPQGCSVVYFNYSIYNGAGQHICPGSGTCGSYDTVYFRSAPKTGTGVHINPGSAVIQANGYQYNPAGLDTDMELDWGIGTSSGASAQVVYANATVGIYDAPETVGCLDHPSTCTYVNPPAAWDFGADTGETGLGAYGWWGYGSNGMYVGHITTGPSLLTGLWNVSTFGPGSFKLNYAGVAPGNAWIGVAIGSGVTNLSYYAVGTTFGWFTPRGKVGPNIYLAPAVYTVLIQLSGYNSYTTTVDLTHSNVQLSVSLVKNAASTTFTPMYAYSSSDLANLSTSGAGTSGNPYILFGGQQGADSFSGLFAGLNDYMFPVWMGIYINGTTAYATWTHLPSVLITYPEWQYSSLQRYNLPFSNQLQIYLYHANNLVLSGGTSVGGWVSANIGGTASGPGRLYMMIVNDGSNDVVARNYFNVSTEGLEFIDAGTNDWVWGNTFVPYSNPAVGILSATTGLTVSQSGDHIYNNEFYTNGTAASSSTYTNFWNVTTAVGSPIGTAPTTYVVNITGTILTGANILGQNYQGGNYWFNYGMHADPYGVLPYVARASAPTGSAVIGKGGDFAPLTIYGRVGAGLYAVTFTESGLLTGGGTIPAWAVRLSNVPVYSPVTGLTTLVPNAVNTTTTSTTTLTLWVPNGTINWAYYTAVPASRYLAVTSGSFMVAGTPVGVSITFQYGYAATFTESGLVSPIRWYLNVTGLPSVTSTATTAAITLPNATAPAGFYHYALATGGNTYQTNPATGNFNISGATFARSVTYTAVTFLVTFTETGLPASTAWYVNGTSQVSASSTSTTLTASFTNGTIAYTVATTNKIYAVSPIHYTVAVAAAPVTGPTFTFNVFRTNAVTFTETGLGAGTAWAVSLNGVLKSSTATTTVFSSVNGSFPYAVASIAGQAPTPASGTVTVHGTTNGGTIVFATTGYSVSFSEVGLAAGTSWSVTLNSVLHSSTTPTITFSEAAGTYGYSVGAIAGSVASPSSGSVTVTSASVGVAISFSTTTYAVAFPEAGAFSGAWAVQLGGVLRAASSGPISFQMPNGSYPYSIASVSGYTASPPSGTVTVSGSGSSTTITFTAAVAPTYNLQFTENGLPAGTMWSATVATVGTMSSTGTTITFTGLAAGVYSYSFGAVAAFSTPGGGSTTISTGSQSIGVTYAQPTFAITFTESGLPAGTFWAVTFNGQIGVSTTTTIVFQAAAGTYSFSVSVIGSYSPSPSSGMLVVSGATGQSVTYTVIPVAGFPASVASPVAPGRTE